MKHFVSLRNLNFSKRKRNVLWTDFLIFSLGDLPSIFEYSILDILTTLNTWKRVWYWVCNFLVVWLWFKVENICDISIIMYNLHHCFLERFHLLGGEFKLTVYWFWSSMTHEQKLFLFTNHYIIFFFCSHGFCDLRTVKNYFVPSDKRNILA